ncbi:hypothetical protein J7T55_005105 [Diaporthe amygdali]|uniref:uncharacterized protein n=1 Tax=Phomopsis amygdali TaxID=1214568 RepID=UPI0022FE0133|nr:uncharacterized protein J7T55_005105 [Diaporthe amygdali]KAJ0116159.1 hypothetical protein J7T55_005105 [Diaporthe amygdali]
MPCKFEPALNSCKGFCASPEHGTAPKKRPSSLLTLSFCLLICLISAHLGGRSLARLSPFFQPVSNDDEQRRNEFRWADITPTTTLRYTPCWDSFQCARLSVPLDWNSTIEEHRIGPYAAIAIVKLPARVPVTDARYGGPVVLNPGGPGESGIYQVLSDARQLQTVLDSPRGPEEITNHGEEAGKYFDILSFDPRGVNNTTPALRCFPGAFNQQTWLLRFPDIGLLWDSESLVGLERARAAALGASCSSGGAEEDVLPYLNTAQVVEDMVEIIEREGQWRAEEASRLLEINNSHKNQLGRNLKLEVHQRTAYHPGQEKLQFWGMSYGTTLGSTFAALHPDRVARIVLDGNMDPAEHYRGGFEKSLQDADKVVTQYSTYCFAAGPEKCRLFNVTSPDSIEARFTSIMSSLKTNPIAVSLPGNLGPEVITFGDVHLLLLTSIFFSFAFAERFWDLLPILEAGNGTHPEMVAMALWKQARLTPAAQLEPESDCNSITGGGDPDSCLPYHSWAGAFKTISCMDVGGGPTHLTREAFAAARKRLAAQSRWASPTWSRNVLSCEGLTAQPAWRPSLAFEKQEWANTSHPILFIGNSYDPATPLANAKRVSGKLFPGSMVLQQDSEGHCSHASPSLCTASAVREYFQTGRLPRPGTICQPEVKPFLGCVRKGGCRFEGDDARLWEALVQLADPFGLTKRDGVEIDLYEDIWRATGRIARN